MELKKFLNENLFDSIHWDNLYKCDQSTPSVFAVLSTLKKIGCFNHIVVTLVSAFYAVHQYL